jgi:hypothetical protein
LESLVSPTTTSSLLSLPSVPLPRLSNKAKSRLLRLSLGLGPFALAESSLGAFTRDKAVKRFTSQRLHGAITELFSATLGSRLGRTAILTRKRTGSTSRACSRT